MSIKSQLALAAALAIALLAYAASAAQAGGDYRQAKFKAEVKGVQTYAGDYHHSPSDPCDPPIDSVTNEKVTFRSTKAVPFWVTELPNTKDPILTGGTKALQFPVKATVKRSHNYGAGSVPPTCPDNGGGVEEVTAPDCGTRKASMSLSVDYYRTGHVELQPANNNVADPFERCGSGRFPYLLSGVSFGKRQDAELPAEELFDEKIGKLITIGSGTEGIVGPETVDDTRIRWELSLTRLK